MSQSSLLLFKLKFTTNKKRFMLRKILTDIPKNLLQNFDSLKFLDLSDNRMTKFSITPAKSLKKLLLRNSKFRCNADNKLS